MGFSGLKDKIFGSDECTHKSKTDHCECGRKGKWIRSPKSNDRKLLNAHVDIINHLVNAVNGCSTTQTANVPDPSTRKLKNTTPQNMLDAIKKDMRTAEELAPKADREKLVAANKKLTDPIDKNFSWDRTIYGPARVGSKLAAIAIPGGIFAFWWVSKEIFFTWF